MLQKGWGRERAGAPPTSSFIPLRKNFKAEFSSAALGEQVSLPSTELGMGRFDPVCDSSCHTAIDSEINPVTSEG